MATAYEALPNRRYIRYFSSKLPTTFAVFNQIRTTTRTVSLSEKQLSSVMKGFEATISGQEAGGVMEVEKRISDPLPFVSVFFEQLCPQAISPKATRPLSGATFLLLSVITGNLELCERCLRAGANPNNMSFLQDEKPAMSEMFHGYSPMYIAVLAEQMEVLELLSRYGGSVNVYDRWGRSPLLAAVQMDNVDLARWLLEKGAERFHRDSFGLTPTAHAVGMPMIRLLEEVSVEEKKEDGTVQIVRLCGTKEGLCSCGSGRAKYRCGCVDDMYARHRDERSNFTWAPQGDFKKILEAEQHMLAQKKIRMVLAAQKKTVQK
ncbi:hypothetical protein STCU_06520 [Strigomonas culicis]|uniref:Uncharacterized protein n=1 Tax=Strigomonas culicis TaxID=28005 RepID=S9U9W2_9TRYP|nr:hypothetical protein STCU_06520 [Strigomonas culicis]|eukprot:EPY25723.1 hypothetical protein STCU_06520 [Strigomonas culicis]